MSRFVNTIEELAELIVDFQVADWDVVNIVTGTPGVGKSVFIFRLLYAVTGILRKRGIANNYMDPTKDLWFSRDEVNEWLTESDQFSAGAADEGVGMFYSRDYHEPEQKALLKKMDRMREAKNFVFSILIPNFFSVDSHIRNGRVSFWIHLDKRRGQGKTGYAHGTVYQKDENNFAKDPWNLNYNAKLWSQKRTHNSPNYAGEIIFYDLEDDHKKIYKKVKLLKREMAEMLEWRDAKKWGKT